jgi:hypothetical protein
MLGENYKINWFIMRQAFIGSLTWFITYFLFRKLLNPYNWKYDMDEIFIESLFGAFAMFMMLVMNFILFKFYDCDNDRNKKILDEVKLTYNHN